MPERVRTDLSGGNALTYRDPDILEIVEKPKDTRGFHGVAPPVGRGADPCLDGPMPSLVEG